MLGKFSFKLGVLTKEKISSSTCRPFNNKQDKNPLSLLTLNKILK